MLRSHLLRQTGDVAAGAQPTGVSFIGYEESIADTSDGVAQTFSGVSFGTEVPNREVVVVLSWRTNRSSGGSMSVTVGGQSATSLVFKRSGSSLFSACVEIFKAAPSGDSGDIVVTNTGRDVDWLGVGVYAAYGYIGGVYDTASGSGVTLNLSSSEADTSIIAGAAGNSTGAFSFGGSVTSDADVNVDPSGDSDRYAFASASALAAGSYTVTTSGSHSQEAQAAVALISPPGGAPITFVGGIDELFTTSGTQVFSLPTCQQDDILVLIGGHTATTGTAPFGTKVATGWTSLDNGVNSDHSFIAAYKIMGATPDTQIDVGNFAIGGDANGSLKLAVFRGVDTTTPMDATFQKVTSGSSDMDPPAITTVTDYAMVVTGGYIDNEEATGPPTGYTVVGNDNLGAAMAYKPSLAGSVNPGPFVLTGGGPSVAYTIALRPAP